MFDLLEREPTLVGRLSAPRSGCSDAELIDRIAVAEQVMASVQALQLRDVHAFVEARRAADRALAGVGASLVGRTTPMEVACARGVAPTTAAHQIEVAAALVEDHPRLLSCLAAGRVSLAAVRKVVEETVVLEPELRRQVDANLADLVAEQRMTPAKLAGAAVRQVIGADPAAAMRRCERARKDRSVSIFDKRDGTATLWARLTAEQALAGHQALDRDARSLRQAGDERSLADLRCDLLVERLTAPGGVGRRRRRLSRRQRATRRVELQVVMAASTLLGVDDAPATLRGYGALPAELALRIADGPDTQLRRLICDPVDGRLLTMDSRTRCYSGLLRQLVVWRDQVCRGCGCDAPVADVDHLLEHQRGGPTTASNGQGLSRGCHVSRHHPGVLVSPEHMPAEQMPDAHMAVEHQTDAAEPGTRCLTQLRLAAPTLVWTMPTGHTYRSLPPPVLGHGSQFRSTPKLRPRHGSAVEDALRFRIRRHRLTSAAPRPPLRT